MKKYFLFIVLSLVNPAFGEEEPPPYVCYAEEIIRNFVPKIKKTFNLSCCGEISGMPYDIECLGLRFINYGRATKEEARALTVLVTEMFLEAINSHEEIRPYLREYPFPASRAYVCISFLDRSGEEYSDGSISYVSHLGPDIYYRANDAFEDRLEKVFEETYEEAAKIVQIAGITKPLEHQTTELEAAFDKSLMSFRKAMRRHYKCGAIRVGYKQNLEEVCVSCDVFRRATEKEAREAQVFATETLLGILNQNFSSHLVAPEQLRIRLCFKKNKAWVGPVPYEDGSVECVQLEGGEVTYLWGEETKSELYERALEIAGKPKPSKFAYWRKLFFPLTMFF